MRFPSYAFNTFINNDHANTAAFQHRPRPIPSTNISITDPNPNATTLITDTLSAISSLPTMPNMDPPHTPPPIPDEANESDTNHNIENYTMTSDDETPTSNQNTTNTNDLMHTIDDLQEELTLEQENNNAARDNMTWQQQNHAKAIAILTDKINHLRKQQQQTPPTPIPSTTPPPLPPITDPTILELIKQQQQMLTSHMAQNSQILSEFGKGIQSLQEATMKTANAAEKQTQETIDSRIKRGPKTKNKLPKFSNSSNEIFIDWYDDVLSILALSEWTGIYDHTISDIYPKTTETNKNLSEHLYTSLRLALHGEAGSTMKGNEHKHRNHGIELLHSMKPIFHQKWPPSMHNTKLIEFYSYFRQPSTSIDTYANKFKRNTRDLHYNGIIISPESAKHAFIQGLGAEFIPIRNMKTPSEEFQTDDIDALTASARDHLTRVLGNREIQKIQSAIVCQNNPPTNPHPNPNHTNPPATPAPSTTPRSPPPSTPPPIPRRPQAEQTDWQREIMREIGFRCHTADRQTYWQSLTKPNACYFHRSTNHCTRDCDIINRATTRANAGSAPTSPFVPNPRFQTSPTTCINSPTKTTNTGTHSSRTRSQCRKRRQQPRFQWRFRHIRY